MKGIQSLIVAAGLGVVGAILNYAYLHTESQKLNLVYFIGVKPGTTISAGERLKADSLERVGIPAQNVGNLQEYAILYKDLNTLEGEPVWRMIPEGSLLLRDDLHTPPQELNLAKGQKLLWIPVDTRTFVPSLVVPGDMVSFLVSAPTRAAARPAAAPHSDADGGAAATPGDNANPTPEAAPAVPGSVRRIGPFRVVSLGNRLGRPEVMRAVRIPQVQENVMGISVGVKANGDLQDDAQTLWNLLIATNFRAVGVMLDEQKAANK